MPGDRCSCLHIERITTIDVALGAHLRRRVRTGPCCGYHPEAGDVREWILD
jgi:hypothetical protein